MADFSQIPKRGVGPVLRILLCVIAFLAARAGAPLPAFAQRATGWRDNAPADRAGELVPAPQQSIEPELGRSIWSITALWTAVGLVLAVLAVGYVRRRWRSRGGKQVAVARQKRR